MKIILAQTAGFCFGVKRAVDMAFECESTEGTYTFGPIIHNEVVIDALEKKGVKAVEKIEGDNMRTLIIRAHGVNPSIYKQGEEKGIDIVDATCPYVKKIHRIVEKYSQNGHKVIIAGDKNHPEIIGINGWAKEGCIIVKDVEELKTLTLEKDNTHYLLVAQTTYKKEVVDAIVEELNAQGINFEFNNTICSATKERQEEAIRVASQVECMLVLGGKKSSNTVKLYEISKKYCERSYCIATAEELTADMISGTEVIGITAGASTPECVIQDVIKKLHELEEKQGKKPKTWDEAIKELGSFILKSKEEEAKKLENEQ